MTSHRIGVNLRVSGNCDQGARKYMEDNHVIKFLKKNTDDYEFAYFGIFDGHGGPEASAYCRDNLLNEITKYDGFWTNDDSQVLSAIRKGFLDTHLAMWNVIDSWPKTVTGLPSTAGSTATIAIIKQGKLYTGHVGDSALVLGENDAYGGLQNPVQAICVTKEHKPDDPDERLRIEDAGGEVISKSGVPRVVWSRPKMNHKGPVRRSTHIDQIPFLAVARSLGDLWSYDYYTETYVVSPDPDVAVLPLDPTKHRCLILASDGLWNMLTPEESVNVVMDLESQFEEKIITDPNVAVSFWSNPAERLVARALNKWRAKSLKADNTSCVVVLIDPLGPSKLTLLKRKRQEMLSKGETFGTSSSASQSKIAKLHTESELRSGGKTQGNKNANCSLSDSHIRVTDDSMIMPHSDKGMRLSAACRTASECDEPSADEDSINESVQFFPKATEPSIKWNLRHHLEEKKYISSGKNVHPLNKTSQSFTHIRGHRSPDGKSYDQSFTKLLEIPKHALKKGNTLATMGGEASDFPQPPNPNRSSIANIEEEEEEEEDSIFDQGEEIPNPPPSTPCTEEQSDSENTLHSSADVTDTAFSLASDESLGTPARSLRASQRPTTPLSAPSKLSSAHARKSHLSKSAKRKLARRTNMFAKPPTGHSTKAEAPVKTKGAEVKSKSSSSQAASASSSQSFSITPAVEMKNAWALASSTQGNTNSGSSTTCKVNSSTSTTREMGTSPPCPPDLRSPVRRVLNTSRSMNDVATPSGPREPPKSRSCSGLTPAMDQLMSENPSVHSHRFLSNATTAIVNDKTLKPSNKAFKASVEENLVIDDVNTSQAPEPLRQLNKTSSGSRRWGNFLRGSKLSLEQMFHVGSHSKTGKHGTASKKLNTTSSTGVLEGKSNNVTVVSRSTKTTSMSTSRLPDMSLSEQHRHLPDITLSHYADLNSTTATTGDLSAVSAIDVDDVDYEDESMLSLQDAGLTNAHHSMLEDGVTGSHRLPGGKIGKRHQKGFLQKTRVTLSRARKAAKKAFFPENHRLVTKDKKQVAGVSPLKRHSDEFLSTPETKRRKQQETDKL
ncbi:protein phosphatase 1d [Plakobranchus ocellatus]|uniref:Protein phosphatase 1d n=1 Tax=Plakobranchus ocellatus TaxID=259542 RepID=A0AAV4CED1_9GAST|nr:protein phosphatase 1d [Plakobranchus ocellatus]